MFHEGKADGFAVAVFDADNSPLSRKITSWIEATPEVTITDKINSLEEGKKLLERGDVHGVLMIPNGLENQVYAGTPKKMSAIGDC
jgi:ABC-2 type transport system permease protein